MHKQMNLEIKESSGNKALYLGKRVLTSICLSTNLRKIIMSVVLYSINKINKKSLELTKGIIVDYQTTLDQLREVEATIEKSFLDPSGTKYVFDGWYFPGLNPTRTGWKSVLVHIDRYGDWVQTTTGYEAPKDIYFRPYYRED